MIESKYHYYDKMAVTNADRVTAQYIRKRKWPRAWGKDLKEFIFLSPLVLLSIIE